MARAAPTLLVLLSLTVTICDAQDSCPGEWGRNPTAILLRQPVSSPPEHKELGAGGGEYDSFPSMLFFF